MLILFLLLQEAAAAPITLEKIFIFLGGSTFVGLILGLAKLVVDRMNKITERKQKQDETQISASVDFKKMEFESADAARVWLEKILGIRDAEIVRLKDELKIKNGDLESNEDKFNSIEKELRRVRREFEILDIYYFKNEKNDNLKLQFGIVRTSLDELEKCFQDEKRET